MNDLEKNNMSTTNTHIQTFKIKKKKLINYVFDKNIKKNEKVKFSI